MITKIAPFFPRHRDSFPAKVPGQVADWLTQVTLTIYTTELLLQKIKETAINIYIS